LYEDLVRVMARDCSQPISLFKLDTENLRPIPGKGPPEWDGMRKSSR